MLPSFELPSADKALEAVLDQFDKAPSDLTVAFAGTTNLTLIAYRLEGVEGSQFVNTFLAAAGEDSEVTVTDAAYGGKAVRKIVSSNPTIGTVYVHTAGDVMYIVGGDAIADAVLTETFSKIG